MIPPLDRRGFLQWLLATGWAAINWPLTVFDTPEVDRMAFPDKPSNPKHNQLGRRADQCFVNLPLDDTGVNLDNDGWQRDVSSGTPYLAKGTGTTDTAVSTSEATSIHTNDGTLELSQVANSYMVACSPTSEIRLKQGCMLLAVTMDSTLSTNIPLVFNTVESGGEQDVADSFQFVVRGANDRPRLTVYDTTGNSAELDGAASVPGSATDYVFFVRWSAAGVDLFVRSATVDEKVTKPSDGISFDAFNFVVPAGGHLRVGANHRGANNGDGTTLFAGFEVLAFNLWRVWMDDTDVEELLNDPFQMRRPPAPEGLFLYRNNPLPLWPTTDGGCFNCPTGAISSGTAQWRLRYRTPGSSGWTTSATASETAQYTANPIVLTGLPSGTQYEWEADYNAGAGWQLFPGGGGLFETSHAEGAAVVPTICKIDDDHGGHSIAPRSAVLDQMGAYAGTNAGVTSGGVTKGVYPVALNAWKTGYHARRQTPHLNIWGGDNSQLDGYDDGETKTNDDIRPVSFDHIARHYWLWNDLAKSAFNLWVRGNHEHMGGYFHYADKNEEVAACKQATVAWKVCYYPPQHDTYTYSGVQGAEGGTVYDSTDDWRPSGTDSAGNAFDAAFFSTYVDDARGLNAKPLGNFYAVRTGRVSIVILDNYLYSNVGDTIEGDYTQGLGGVHYQQQRVWVMGDTQKEWFAAYNDTLPASVDVRYVVSHQQFGGAEIPVAGNSNNGPFYGYGNGLVLYTETERWLVNEMAEHGYTWYLVGHSHKGSHVEQVGGVNIWVGPACAPSISFRTAWNEDVFSGTFGTSASSWTDTPVDSDDVPIGPRLKYTFNVIGFTRLDGKRLRCIRTAFSRDWLNVNFEGSGTRTVPTDMENTTLENERFVSARTIVTSATGIADLGESFTEVQLVLREADITGTFWVGYTDRLTSPAGLYRHMDYDNPTATTVQTTISNTPVRVAYAPETVYDVTVENAQHGGGTDAETTVDGLPVPGSVGEPAQASTSRLTGGFVSFNKQSIQGRI